MKLTDITNFLGVTDYKKEKSIEPESKEFSREKLGPKDVFMSWTDYPKPITTSMDPRFKKTFFIVGSVVALLFLMLEEYFLLLFVASVFFLTQVLAKSKMDDIKYELSNHGISLDGEMFYWDSLSRYFFASQFGSENIAIDVKEGLPPRLFIAYKEKDREKIKEYLSQHLPFLEEEPKNFMDKAYTSVIDKFDFQKK